MIGSASFPDDPPGVFFSVEGSSDELEDKIDNQAYRNRLSAIISDEEQSTSEKLQAILQLGTEWFGVEHGHLVRIDPAEGTYTIIEVSGPHPKISPGRTADLTTTYCRRVLAGGDGMAVENAPEQGLAKDRAYQEFGFATYLGAKVVVGEQLFGTVCFVDEEPLVEPFTESDAAALALIVRTVGQELERSRREDRLRQSRARLEALFEDAPDMINIYDLEGNLILPNPQLCENTGYDEEALTDMKVWDLDRELDSEEARARWEEMEPGDRQRREGRYWRKDGSTFPVEVDVRCLDLEGVDRFVATSRDITERKKRERKLRVLSEAMEQAREAMLITEAEPLEEAGPRIVYVNAAFEAMTGYEEDEVLGKTPRLLQGPETEREVLDSLREALEAGESWQGETINYRKDGTPFLLQWNVAPVRNGDGELEYWVSVQRDVTEEREREKRLRQMGLALEQIGDKVVITDREGRIQYVNEAFETVTGYSEEEVLGRTPKVLQSGEHDESFYEELWETILSGETFRAEVTNERKDGSRYTEDESISPLTDEEGEITHFVSCARDITERKETEQALEEREARLRGLAHSIPGVVFEHTKTFGADGSYGSHFVSEQAEKLLGISADPDGFHSRFAEQIPDAHREEFLASVEAAFEAEKPWQLEVPFEKPSGERIWLLGASTPQRRGEELVFNGVLLDITERKTAEIALQEERDRFATLFDNLPTPVVQGRVSEEGRMQIEAANEAFQSVFVRDRDSVRGKDLQELIVPDAEEEEAAVLRRRLATGKRIDRVVQRETVEGLRDFRLQVATREKEDPPPEGYAIYTDVTEERRRRERQRHQQEALLELTNDERVVAGDFESAVQQITERAAEVLEVARVNVWLFDDEEHLQCQDHYDRRSDDHSADMELMPEQYPSYFEALSQHRVIDVSHAPSDPRTSELAEDYLQPHDVGALLDATLHAEGEAVGVVCCEHVGGPREWETDEVQFAGEVADLVHRSLRNQERVERRRELAFQQSLLKAQQEAVLDGLLVVNEKAEVVSYNDRFVELWGVPEALPQQGDDEPVLERVTDQVKHPEKFLEKVEDLYEHPEERSRDEIDLADGRVFDRYTTPLVGEGGIYYGRLWTFRDITERKERERELRRRGRQLEQIRENVTEVLWMSTPAKEEMEFISAAYEEIWGQSTEALKDEPTRFLEAIHPDDRERVRSALELQRKHPEAYEETYRVVQPSGEERWVHDEAAGVYDDSGQLERIVGVATDITERREAERELRETKRLLEKTLESLNEAVLVVDASDRRIVLCNAAVERMFGYEKDELIGETTEVLHVDRQAYERFGEMIAPRLNEQGSFTGEYRMCRKDGQTIDTEHMITPLQGDELSQGVVSVVRDVTERKERERELRRKERRYQAVFEDPNILVGLLDPDGMTLDINQTAMKYIDASLEEVTGIPFWETPWFVGDEELQDTVRQWIDRASDGEYVEFEADLSDAVGEQLIISGVFRPVKNEEGEVTSLLISARDVTERTQSRRRLERYHDYTDRLLNASEDLFFVCDENGNLQRWNERMKAVTGYTEEELSGRSALSLVRDEERDRTKAAIEEVFEAGRSQLDVALLTKDGSTVPYEFTGNRVEHPDGDLRLVGIGRDMTERKRREQALVEAKTKAEEASRLKSALLANMSHEIRTPLTSVTGFSEVLKGELEGQPSDLADRIHKSGQRLMKTLDSVLQLSKLEAGVYDLELEPVSLREVVGEITEMLRPSAEEKSLALVEDLPEAPVNGVWNEGALNRIVENLLENAIKFTPEGGNVEVRAWARGEEAVLEVEDDGVGIREDVRSEIFQAFRQESEGLDREYEGSGLGLSIVQQLTEAFGGEVSVESEKGKGTCFTVVLPRHPDAGPSTGGSASPTNSPEPGSFRGVRGSQP